MNKSVNSLGRSVIYIGDRPTEIDSVAADEIIHLREKLSDMTAERNKILEVLEEEHEYRVGDNECHGTGTHCQTCKRIRGFEAVKAMNETEPGWISKHSVNCYFCGALVECALGRSADAFNGGDGGSICPTCLKKACLK